MKKLVIKIPYGSKNVLTIADLEVITLYAEYLAYKRRLVKAGIATSTNSTE